MLRRAQYEQKVVNILTFQQNQSLRFEVDELLKRFVRLFKKVQLRGARKIDERRRTYAVRWSEAIDGNDANELFFQQPDI